MKILVINGSPKDEGSNTIIPTRAFLEGAGWTDAEIISISKIKVRGCTGCYGCWTKTPGKCAIKDDMADILPKLIEADVIVWSFPLYYYNVPGDLKNFIDRQLPLALPEMEKDSESGNHPSRYDLGHQRHAVISTCGFWTHKGNYDAVTAMFKRMEIETTIYIGQGGILPVANAEELPPEMAELKVMIKNYLDIIRRAGKEFAAGEISAQTLVEIAEPILPQEVYEQGANESFGV